MFSPYLKRILIDICLVFSFVLGALFFNKSFIDFLISLFHFGGGKVNPSSLAYCIHRFLVVFLPLIMLTTKTPLMNKNKLIRTVLYIIAGCYFIANTWIFFYMINNPISDLFISSIPVWFVKGDFKEVVDAATRSCYLFQYNNAFVFNYLTWDSYDLFGVLFSLLQGFLYVNLARNIHHHKDIVLRNYLIIIILSAVLPELYGLLVKGRWLFTNSWGQRNMMLIFSSVFVFISMKLASSARVFWNDILF